MFDLLRREIMFEANFFSQTNIIESEQNEVLLFWLKW
jgi:hypothetical protein